jgi:hypothetical protein
VSKLEDRKIKSGPGMMELIFGHNRGVDKATCKAKNMICISGLRTCVRSLVLTESYWEADQATSAEFPRLTKHCILNRSDIFCSNLNSQTIPEAGGEAHAKLVPLVNRLVVNEKPLQMP